MVGGRVASEGSMRCWDSTWLVNGWLSKPKLDMDRKHEEPMKMEHRETVVRLSRQQDKITQTRNIDHDMSTTAGKWRIWRILEG